MLWENCVKVITLLFPTSSTKTPLNIWSFYERPASTLHNLEYEHLADSLMHDRPIKNYAW